MGVLPSVQHEGGDLGGGVMFDVYQSSVICCSRYIDVQVKVKGNKYTQTCIPNGWRVGSIVNPYILPHM
jgi:hypothetical protein